MSLLGMAGIAFVLLALGLAWNAFVDRTFDKIYRETKTGKYRDGLE